MKILGIETSCDETAAAVVEDGTRILSNVVASSLKLHAKTGGIIPEMAAREQIKSVIPVVNEAIGTGQQAIDAIAVTIGPGLIGSLLVGVETAKTLSKIWKKPIIPVNHLVAHIYANFVSEFSISNFQLKPPELPALVLIVSGGHTDLVLMKDHGKIEWIAGTRDDAAGEAFDKCARLLDLPYPGGPSISVAAEEFLRNRSLGTSKLNLFPRPLIKENGFDWSFSGLKTAVMREVKSNPTSLKLRRAELAAQVQEAIVDILIDKTLKAVKKFQPKSLAIAGGVAANKRLREKFELEIENEKLNVKFFAPEPKLCTDNGAVIASAAFFNNHPIPWEEVSANPELTIES